MSNLSSRTLFTLLLIGSAELMATNPASTKYVQEYAAPPASAATTQVQQYAAATTYTIGQYAQGGIVFSLTPDNQHGLVISIDDQGSLPWSINYDVIGATGNSLSFLSNYTTTGKINTALIVAKYGSSNTYAAGECDAYTKTVNGVTYSGWYLPSLAELGLIQSMISTINQAIQAQGGVLLITGGVYWSSFEYDTDAAWVQDFSSAFQHDKYKTDSYLVRAVRAF